MGSFLGVFFCAVSKKGRQKTGSLDFKSPNETVFTPESVKQVRHSMVPSANCCCNNRVSHLHAPHSLPKDKVARFHWLQGTHANCLIVNSVHLHSKALTHQSKLRSFSGTPQEPQHPQLKSTLNCYKINATLTPPPRQPQHPPHPQCPPPRLTQPEHQPAAVPRGAGSQP